MNGIKFRKTCLNSEIALYHCIRLEFLTYFVYNEYFEACKDYLNTILKNIVEITWKSSFSSFSIIIFTNFLTNFVKYL